MWQASEKLWVNGVKETSFLRKKMCFSALWLLRCQEDRERAALLLAPSFCWPFVTGTTTGWATGSGSPCPHSQAFALVFLASPVRRKGCVVPGAHVLSRDTRGPAAALSLLQEHQTSGQFASGSEAPPPPPCALFFPQKPPPPVLLCGCRLMAGSPGLSFLETPLALASPVQMAAVAQRVHVHPALVAACGS